MRHVLFSLAVFALACDEDPDASSDASAEVSDADVDVSDTDAEVSDDDDSDVDDDNDDEVSHADSVDDLLYIREEEKLARDVYQVLGDLYGTRIFDNISQSEQSHMDSLLVHIDRLGLVDPIVDDSTGVFVDEHLQDLYATLVAQGSQDLVGALTVGATIEDLDILDLAIAIETTDDLALADTYDGLMCGSRNHLRSFMGQLDRQGAVYTPQYITQAQFDAIVGSAREQCG